MNISFTYSFIAVFMSTDTSYDICSYIILSLHCETIQQKPITNYCAVHYCTWKLNNSDWFCKRTFTDAVWGTSTKTVAFLNFSGGGTAISHGSGAGPFAAVSRIPPKTGFQQKHKHQPAIKYCFCKLTRENF